MAAKQKQKTNRHNGVNVESCSFVKSSSLDTDNNLNQNEKRNEGISSSNPTVNKYQIPSSMIVLTPQEEAELRYVIMHMTMRDCGL